MDSLESLFQGGPSACFRRGATPEIFLKAVELVMRGETLATCLHP
jgi:hypothetical protein